MTVASPTSADVIRALKALADSKKAAFFPRFFKAGKGEYAEGDRFLGVTVPLIRRVAKEHKALSRSGIVELLESPLHEVRLAGLEILVMQFEHADRAEQHRIVDLYLSRLDRVNNWDLVDGSAPYILGEWLIGTDARTLDELAASTHLWTQRVAIVSTWAFIRRGDLKPTFRIARALLGHPHDLIHKAVGWMLREAGKKDTAALRKFLDEHAATMPRTALRYAIERFDAALRRKYLDAKRLSA